MLALRKCKACLTNIEGQPYIFVKHTLLLQNQGGKTLIIRSLRLSLPILKL